MGEQIMTNLGQVKVFPRDQQVLNLLVQGCSKNSIFACCLCVPESSMDVNG
jgi:hypothetical protein